MMATSDPLRGPGLPPPSGAALPSQAPPAQLLSARFELPPEALWPQLQRSGFIAEYLGACLPPALLRPGQVLEGSDALGRPLQLSVSDAQPPCSLSLVLRDAMGERLLHLAVEASGHGSRLTVVHESPLPGRPSEQPGGPVDPIGLLLAAPPAAVLTAARIGSPPALDLARSYLADSAAAMQLLLGAMATRQGYAKPGPDRFSMVEQIWHLADVEEFGWAQRLPRVLAESRPVLPGVDGDRLARERRYQQQPWRAAARRFIAQRRRSLAALRQFDAATLERPLLFAGAPGDAGSLLAAMLAHDHEHRVEMAGLWTQERKT
jgi:hypothetical protein